MKYLLILVVVLFGSTQVFGATHVQISTSKTTYHYGDHLAVTIEVSEITSSTASIYIIDSTGKKSSPIPIQIRDKTTTITAPNPFDSLLFKEGKYKIELDYNGIKSSTEFEIIDTGNIVMPYGSKTLVPEWAKGIISDYNFLKFLSDKNLVSFPSDQPLRNDIKIPVWYRTNAQWWYDEKISDDEFVKGLQYLIGKKVIA